MLSQEEIHRMAQSEDVEERREAAEKLRWNFAELPDKEQATKDLLALTKDKDFDVRLGAVEALGSAFPHVTDKEQATKDLLALTKYYDFQMRWRATYALGSAFPHITDKEQAWKNLLILINDREMFVKVFAAYALGSAFPHLTDKLQATKDILALTKDDDLQVRMFTAYTLGFALAHVTDKQQATKQLLALTKDEHNFVRWRAAEVLGFAFQHVTDKKQATKDLLALTKDKDIGVRRGATYALGSAFPHLTDKLQATKDLIALTKDENSEVREGTAYALGSTFGHVTDKEQAWGALIKLSGDFDRDVRILANHSLGRASIYRATLCSNENIFTEELEKAMEFFEKASAEATYFNPASFCLPFYRSFHAITSGKNDKEADVDKYLKEAKNAVRGSKSKEKLLEAVENLSNALKEANIDEGRDFGKIKSELNTYRRYCERAAELLDVTEESAPITTKLVGKGLPIIGEQISKKLEIQDKAKAIFEKTKGTSLESLGLELHEEANKLSQLKGLAFESGFDRLIKTVYNFCEHLPETENKKCNRTCDTFNFAIDKQDNVAETLGSFLDINYPKIRRIQISDRKKDIIRIASVQIDFELLTDSFPPNIKEQEKIKDKVFNAINKAKNEGADIVCLPELCVNENWHSEIKYQFDGMLIIPGTCYDKEKHNLCKLIMRHAGEIPFQLKFNPSDYESSRVMGSRMKQGEKLVNIYETEFGKISILICRDFGDFIPFLRGFVDIVFVPSYNKANERFHKDADNHVTNSPSYIIITNTALYGGTSIFGQLDYNHFYALEQGGCKKKGDKSYKLCEIETGTEGMIIADFNVANKFPQKQAPISSEQQIICVGNVQKILF